MLKKLLKTVASASAIAALMVACSQEPMQVKTMGQNGVSAAIIPAVSRAKTVNRVTAGKTVHIMGMDNIIYRYNTNPTNRWDAFSTSVSPSGTLPILKSLAVSTDKDTVFVLGVDSIIYRHIPGTNATNRSAKWTKVNQGTTSKAYDIAVGGYNYNTKQILWKLGNDNNIYRLNGSTFSLVVAGPGANPQGLCWTETPTNARNQNLIVDSIGYVFGLLPVTCGSNCSNAYGRVAFAFGPGSGTWTSNNYDYEQWNIGYGLCWCCGALDIYGIGYFSLSGQVMCFAKNAGHYCQVLIDTSFAISGKTPHMFELDPDTAQVKAIAGVALGPGTGYKPWIIVVGDTLLAYDPVTNTWVNPG